MTYRVKVLLTSELGNHREITTRCETAEIRDKRVAMYKERYPNGDILVEELTEDGK